MRSDPTLAAAACDEGLRLSPPLTFTQRYTLDDLDHDGATIPRHTMIAMHWAAANTDPAAVHQPDQYLLDRPAVHSATFDGGAHLCPGRNISRLVGTIALDALTRPDISVQPRTTQPEWTEHTILRQLRTCPATVRRVAANG